ncbi:unnamed protein product [Urochloa humidicola]
MDLLVVGCGYPSACDPITLDSVGQKGVGYPVPVGYSERKKNLVSASSPPPPPPSRISPCRAPSRPPSSSRPRVFSPSPHYLWHRRTGHALPGSGSAVPHGSTLGNLDLKYLHSTRPHCCRAHSTSVWR